MAKRDRERVCGSKQEKKNLRITKVKKKNTHTHTYAHTNARSARSTHNILALDSFIHNQFFLSSLWVFFFNFYLCLWVSRIQQFIQCVCVCLHALIFCSDVHHFIFLFHLIAHLNTRTMCSFDICSFSINKKLYSFFFASFCFAACRIMKYSQ